MKRNIPLLLFAALGFLLVSFVVFISSYTSSPATRPDEKTQATDNIRRPAAYKMIPDTPTPIAKNNQKYVGFKDYAMFPILDGWNYRSCGDTDLGFTRGKPEDLPCAGGAFPVIQVSEMTKMEFKELVEQSTITKLIQSDKIYVGEVPAVDQVYEIIEDGHGAQLGDRYRLIALDINDMYLTIHLRNETEKPSLNRLLEGIVITNPRK